MIEIFEIINDIFPPIMNSPHFFFREIAHNIQKIVDPMKQHKENSKVRS